MFERFFVKTFGLLLSVGLSSEICMIWTWPNRSSYSHFFKQYPHYVNRVEEIYDKLPFIQYNSTTIRYDIRDTHIHVWTHTKITISPIHASNSAQSGPNSTALVSNCTSYIIFAMGSGRFIASLVHSHINTVHTMMLGVKHLPGLAAMSNEIRLLQHGWALQMILA